MDKERKFNATWPSNGRNILTVKEITELPVDLAGAMDLFALMMGRTPSARLRIHTPPGAKPAEEIVLEVEPAG